MRNYAIGRFAFVHSSVEYHLPVYCLVPLRLPKSCWFMRRVADAKLVSDEFAAFGVGRTLRTPED